MSVQSIAVSPSLALVLNSAGEKNGVDFDYLLQTAMRESSLNPEARAQTSSAVGLFQFLEGTWLEVMKAEGPRLGYSNYANAIKETAGGGYSVADPKLRAEILELRKDPQIAADMAAAFTRRNGDYLSQKFGRMPSAGELYIAHFLGANGAERMFEAGLENPDQIAANLFPRQADANHAIFYSNGEPRTIRQVYRALVSKHEVASKGVEFSAQQLANNSEAPVRVTPVDQLDISFKSLFSSEANPTTQSPISGTNAKQGGAFFVQLYNK